MKIVGLIVEYNPFHNGHLYHIEESLRITGADKVIVVMSGDFVQRGAPAILPKHLRAEMAIRSGVSLVIELPVRYATGSAEFFALGAVSLLDSLGCVDYICFGSESGNIQDLTEVADILLDEPSIYKNQLQIELKNGLSFPKARQKAMDYYNPNISTILADPNNILGVEYIKAIKKLRSPILPFTITRKTSHYHDTELQGNHSSASAIRNSLNKEENDMISNQIPDNCYDILMKSLQIRGPIYADDFSLLLHQKLLTATTESLLEYQDMTEELANRIYNKRNQYVSFNQFCELIKSKNMTYSRISRVLLHVLIEIKSYDAPIDSMNQYARILGFKKSDTMILSKIKEHSKIPLITKLTQVETLLSEDILASNVYETIVTNKYNYPFIHEYEKSIIII